MPQPWKEFLCRKTWISKASSSSRKRKDYQHLQRFELRHNRVLLRTCIYIFITACIIATTSTFVIIMMKANTKGLWICSSIYNTLFLQNYNDYTEMEGKTAPWNKVPSFKLHQFLSSDSEAYPKNQDVLIRHGNIKSTYLLKLQTRKPNKVFSNFYHVIQYKIAWTSTNRLYLNWSLHSLYLHTYLKFISISL